MGESAYFALVSSPLALDQNAVKAVQSSCNCSWQSPWGTWIAFLSEVSRIHILIQEFYDENIEFVLSSYSS